MGSTVSGLVAHAPTTAAIARATYMPKRIGRRSTVILRRHFARCNLRCKLASRLPRLARREGDAGRCVPPTLLDSPPFHSGPRREAPVPVVLAANRKMFRASRAAMIRRPFPWSGCERQPHSQHSDSRAVTSWRVGCDGAPLAMFASRHKRGAGAVTKRRDRPACGEVQASGSQRELSADPRTYSRDAQWQVPARMSSFAPPPGSLRGKPW